MHAPWSKLTTCGHSAILVAWSMSLETDMKPMHMRWWQGTGPQSTPKPAVWTSLYRSAVGVAQPTKEILSSRASKQPGFIELSLQPGHVYRYSGVIWELLESTPIALAHFPSRIYGLCFLESISLVLPKDNHHVAMVMAAEASCVSISGGEGRREHSFACKRANS